MLFKDKHITQLIVQVEPSCSMLSIRTGHEGPSLGDPGIGDDESSDFRRQ